MMLAYSMMRRITAVNSHLMFFGFSPQVGRTALRHIAKQLIAFRVTVLICGVQLSIALRVTQKCLTSFLYSSLCPPRNTLFFSLWRWLPQSSSGWKLVHVPWTKIPASEVYVASWLPRFERPDQWIPVSYHQHTLGQVWTKRSGK